MILNSLRALFRAAALAAALCFCVVTDSPGQTAGTDVSDLTRLSALTRTLAAETAARIGGGGAVSLRVSPSDAHPMVLQIFSEELSRVQARVLLGGLEEGTVLRVDVREMAISTVSVTDSSYFARSTAACGVVATDPVAGTVLWSKEFRAERVDTLRGTAPAFTDYRSAESPSWFDGVIGPIAAIAAAAVIVLLLFTVRGS